MQKVNKHFVSDIDIKLKAFNESQPKSASQNAEIEKYKRIFELRDNADAQSITQGDIWDDNENE